MSLLFLTLRLDTEDCLITTKASLIPRHSKCLKNDTTMQEVLVFTRLERDEQGRLVIAMYYKKV